MTLDVIAAMQHRDREAIHDLQNVQTLLGNQVVLIERDGVRDEQVLLDRLRYTVKKIDRIIEDLTR